MYIIEFFRLTRYSLGNPSDFSDEETFKEGCDLQFAAAVMALNMNMNFLIGKRFALFFLIIQKMYFYRYSGGAGRHPDCHHCYGRL